MFFEKQKFKSSTIVWSGSTAALLIPTCIILSPLGEEKNKAKKERNEARDQVKQTKEQLLEAEKNLNEQKHLLSDIRCAQRGYQQFNTKLKDLMNEISSSPFPADIKLNNYWGLSITPHVSHIQTKTEEKEYTTTELVPVQRYRCHTRADGSQQCGYELDWEQRYDHHSYKVITTITNEYNNKIDGSRTNLLSMYCGYYSRKIKTHSPKFFVTRRTDESTTGSRESGTINIAYTQKMGSKVPFNFYLDGKSHKTDVISPSGSYQRAVNTVESGLFSLLTSAFALYNSTGSNYPDVQRKIEDNIGSLIEKINTINQTLQIQQIVLGEMENIFDEKNDKYHKGLSLWLPLLFLVPVALAGSVYFMSYKNKDEDEEPEIEMFPPRFEP